MERSSLLPALKALASTHDGRMTLKYVAEAHGIVAGGKWDNVSDDDLALLHSICVVGVQKKVPMTEAELEANCERLGL